MFDIFDFVVYNNSTTFNSLEILKEAHELTGDNFRCMRTHSWDYPNTSRTLDDINHQIEKLYNYDFYFWMDAGCSRFFDGVNINLKWPNESLLNNEKLTIQCNQNKNIEVLLLQ